MKALAILLAASVAHAQPVDAPTVDRPVEVVRAGTVLAYDGVCMTDRKAVETGKRLASCEATMAAVETKTLVSTPVLVGGVVAIVVVAFAAGAATAYAAIRR